MRQECTVGGATQQDVSYEWATVLRLAAGFKICLCCTSPLHTSSLLMNATCRTSTPLLHRRYPPGMHVLVHGFVDNMPELMAASDILITKAGPGTISEGLICGLPLILNAFIPCQEEGNIPYVTDNGVGVFESNPSKAAAVVQQWLQGSGEQLAQLAQRAKALGRPDALLDIVRDLTTLVAAPSV